jgi:hypothetical protein
MATRSQETEAPIIEGNQRGAMQDHADQDTDGSINEDETDAGVAEICRYDYSVTGQAQMVGNS